MVEDLPVNALKTCRSCGGQISVVRLQAVPRTELCVHCQGRVERRGEADRVPASSAVGRDAGGALVQAGMSEADTVTFEGDRLSIGTWSEGFVESAARSAKVRDLLNKGDREGAAALVRSFPVEAQAALVAVDVDPEQMLSLTGMDVGGKPAYRTDVIDLLPAELLTEVISVDPEEKKYNTQLMRSMSPEAFGRTLAETLTTVDNTANRTQVTWEWLVALSEMGDPNRAGDLLAGVDPSLLEAAVLDHLEDLDLYGVLEVPDMGSVPRATLFSEKSTASLTLANYIEDPETRAVISALSEAAPELLRYIVRMAWEVSGAGGGSQDAASGEDTP